MKLFLWSIVVAALVTAISVFLVAGFDKGFEPELIETLAVATSFSCTFLCAYQSRWNYPVGIVSVALYSWILFHAELPGVAFFNLYLVGSLAYGWWRWGPDSDTLPVTDLSGWKAYANYAGLGLTITFLLYMLSMTIQMEISAADYLVTGLSAIAQFLLDNKRRQTWIVWAVVNVVSIGMYLDAGLYLVTVQYCVFLVNTVWGYYKWGKEDASIPTIFFPPLSEKYRTTEYAKLYRDKR